MVRIGVRGLLPYLAVRKFEYGLSAPTFKRAIYQALDCACTVPPTALRSLKNPTRELAKPLVQSLHLAGGEFVQSSSLELTRAHKLTNIDWSWLIRTLSLGMVCGGSSKQRGHEYNHNHVSHEATHLRCASGGKPVCLRHERRAFSNDDHRPHLSRSLSSNSAILCLTSLVFL